MPILLLKSLHLVSVIIWAAALIVLPRVFAQHAGVTDAGARAALVRLERQLHLLMNIGAVLAIAFGVAQIGATGWSQYEHQGWMHAKLTLVVLVIAYHGWCSLTVRAFRLDRNSRSVRSFAILREVPLALLAAIILLVIVKPF